MLPITPADIRRALANVTKSERAAVTVPADFAETDWGTLDFYGWRDPKFPQRGYLVRADAGSMVAVGVTTPPTGLAGGRKAMCAICRAVDNSTAIALFAARRAGAPGRNGNTVGTYICTGLDCSAQLRQPSHKAGRTLLDQAKDADTVAAEMLARLDAFIDAVVAV